MNLTHIFDYITWKIKHSGKLKKYKDIHKGKSCFIIGNGPSLNKMDLTKLNNHYTFGLNKIYLMQERVNLDISYLVSVNDLVIEQSVDQFNKSKVPTFLSYKASKNLPFVNSNIEYIYTKGGSFFQENILDKVREGSTVTFVAMQLAYWMGFEKIFLIGVDHSFVTQGKPHEIQTLKTEDVNHFDPNYFKGMKWGLPDLESSERSYESAKEVFEKAGREIVDATVDGKLQVYSKISYEEALKQASIK